jgi:UDP-N-acetyl-D-glucosamine dehydrogenase
MLIKACELVARVIVDNSLVVNESTSYIGTLRDLIKPKIDKLSSAKNIMYAVAPERIDPGNIKWGMKNTARVIAGLDDIATQMAIKFYSKFCNKIHIASKPEVAEAAKLFENTYRQVNIALVNELSNIANAIGFSTHETIKAASTKPFGFMPFYPSIGVGGHCIPVDPSYLAHVANEVGVPATFIKRANEVNLAMPAYVVKRVIAGCGGSIKGKKVVVVGVSYKSNVADTRETPAAAVIDLIRAQGATVTWHDDLVGSWRSESSAPIKGADIAVLVTKHDGLDLAALKSCGYIFDCTGTLPGVDGI